MKKIILAMVAVVMFATGANAGWRYEGRYEDINSCLFEIGQLSDTLLTASDFSLGGSLSTCMVSRGYYTPKPQDDPLELDSYLYANYTKDANACHYDIFKASPRANPTQNPWTLRESGGRIDPDYYKWFALCIRSKNYEWVSE